MQEPYVNQRMNPQGDLLTTHEMEPGWEITIELYRSRRFRCIANQDCQFGNNSVRNHTQT
jgi:hypothetical protein